MVGKRRNFWIILSLAAAAAIAVILASTAVNPSTEALIEDLALTRGREGHVAFTALVQKGAECVPQLIRQYKGTKDIAHKQSIVSVMTSMVRPGDNVVVVPALIDLLAEEQEPKLREWIVRGLQVQTDREFPGPDPLGDDAEAWRKWWQEQSQKMQAEK